MGRRLGINTRFYEPYKMCDLKPTFGISQRDVIDNSDFWGHVDCDMVLGDLGAFLSEDVLRKNDIVSLRGRGFVHGPLTLYRNTDAINRLYERAGQWRQTLSNPQYLGFDETGGWWPWKGQSRPPGTPESFTDVVLRASETGEVRWYDEDHVKESRPHKGMRVRWTRCNGRETMVDENGQPIAYYHLLTAKSDPAFRMPAWSLDAFPDHFVVTERGVRADHESHLALDIRWAIDRAQHRAQRVVRRLRPRGA